MAYFWLSSATAFATALHTLSSKAPGIIYSSFNSSSLIILAIALAAAIFISSVICPALASKAPLKIPGNTNTLLIWFGKSDLHVAITIAPPFFA